MDVKTSTLSSPRYVFWNTYLKPIKSATYRCLYQCNYLSNLVPNLTRFERQALPKNYRCHFGKQPIIFVNVSALFNSFIFSPNLDNHSWSGLKGFHFLFVVSTFQYVSRFDANQLCEGLIRWSALYLALSTIHSASFRFLSSDINLGVFGRFSINTAEI